MLDEMVGSAALYPPYEIVCIWSRERCGSFLTASYRATELTH